MQSSSFPPASLQSLLQRSEPLPDCIQVKAKGFKNILGSVAEFLENYQVQANVFVKLPTGSVWQEDILRYGQTLDSHHHIFQVVRPAAEALVPASPASGHKVTGMEAVAIPITLDTGQAWRGDYFVLIQSATFAALIAAHRLQRSLVVGDDGNPDNPEDHDEMGPLHRANLHPQVLAHESATAHRSVYLSVYVSLQPGLLDALQRAIRQAIDHCVATTEAHPLLADVAQHWERYCPTVDCASSAFLMMVDRWLLWQVRLQEQLRQSVVTYRQQALDMSTLSSQNEVLINTLRLKDEFLNTVGQELRTPLTTIKTALTLLDSPHLKPPQRQRYMEMISHECDRQSALISGVLDLLQIEASASQAHLVPVHLDETVPPVVSTYQPLAEEKGVLLAYTIPKNLPKVVCPDVWLRQIMIHLLNNSIRHTPSGGEVWVTARPSDDMVELEVRDTGLGIATNDLPRVFDYFYRGRNLPNDVPEGAGLGLSIVQQLSMLCGGTVVVSSQPDRGTTFLVRLPIYEA